MKKTYLLVLLVIGSFLKAQETKRVLFLGNSYTYFNNLPSLIDNLALSQGNDLIYDSNTPGGYTFQGHSTNNISLSKIRAQDWDFVVLQEQSQIPSFPPAQVASDCYPYAAILNDSILSNNPCTEPLFYMTWGRKNGDASNCGFYPPLCTYSGMQQRLSESYMELAQDNNASVAPVGVAWQAVRNLYPLIELYNPDESHPSLEGSYLAACVFYSSMFRTTTVGNSYWAGLDSLTAYRLQVVGSSTVLDSLSVWLIGANDLSLELPSDTIFCGDSLSLLATGNFSSIEWSSGQTVNPIWVANSNLYSAEIENERGCVLLDSVEVNVAGAYSDTFSLRGCDSLLLAGQVFYNDTSFEQVYTSIGGCDSSVYFSLSVDTPFILEAYLSQIILLKSESLGIYFEMYANASDSLWLMDSAYNLIYTTTNNSDNYEYACPQNFLSGTFYMLVFNPCSIDTFHMVGICSENSAIQELNQSWSVFPNPSSGLVNISNAENQGFSLRLLNILGQDLYKGVYHESPAETLDLKSFENASFFILIYDEKNNVVGKKMIQKF